MPYQLEDLPCSARVADGAIRGAGLGVLWAVWYGRSEVEAAQATSKLATARPLVYGLRFGVGSALSFGALIGVYNGLFCTSEKYFGRGLASPLLAGTVMGTVLGCAFTPHQPAPIAATAFATAALCAGTHLVWGPSDRT